MNKNKTDFETTVLDYLSRHPPVRRERLIEKLIEDHPDQSGYSIPSINRKLKNMKKADLISIEKDPEVLKQYGIKKEAENASYILGRNDSKIKKHLDSLFNLMKPENDNDKEKVLDEIKRYELTEDDIDKKTVLVEIKRFGLIMYPNQLDILVSSLGSEDDGLNNDLIETLYDRIIDRGNKPGDKETFLEKLNDLLKRDPEIYKEYPGLKRRVIKLLGYYNDKAVLEQLKKDIKSGKLPTFQDCYEEKYTARIIEEGRTELFYLENQLRKKGDAKTADTLSQIRHKASKYA